MSLRGIAEIDAAKKGEMIAFYAWMSRNRRGVIGISENQGCGLCCGDVFSLELKEGIELPPADCFPMNRTFDATTLRFGSQKDAIIDESIEFAREHFDRGSDPNGVHPDIMLENPESEADSEFCAALQQVLLQTFDEVPWWIRFCVGGFYSWNGRRFRRLTCQGGSIAYHLLYRAYRDGGFQKAIIFRTDYDCPNPVFAVQSGTESKILPTTISELG